MNTKYTKKDIEYMQIAIDHAKYGLKKGDYPVSAVLVINGKYIDKERNKINKQKNWTSHAELNLIKKHSQLIKEHGKNDNHSIEIYTTLEPCLMCLGAAILNRVTKIIYSCPDPHGGAADIDISSLKEWYIKKFPKVVGGLFKEESYNLLTEYMRKQKGNDWKDILKKFEKIKT
jgi:tRNA(adenine34) deaminase